MSSKGHEAFCLDSARRRFHFGDHFLGDSLRDLWAVLGTGSAVVVDAQDGGIVRITTGATTNDSYELYWGNIRSLLVTKKVTIEARVKLGQLTQHDVWISLYTDGADYIRFLNFAVGAAATWVIRTNDGGVGVDVTTGVVADSDWHIYRIECLPTGEVHFYIDDTETANSPITIKTYSERFTLIPPFLNYLLQT